MKKKKEDAKQVKADDKDLPPVRGTDHWRL